MNMQLMGARSRMNHLPSGTGDPYWANVSSLLHFDGANGSTTFTDQKSNVWTPSGDAKIDTSVKKFGTGSGLFDGSGDYISTPQTTDFDIQAGDFTLECWVYRAVSGAQHYLFSRRPSGAGQSGWEWRINDTNTLQFFYTGGSSLTSSSTVPSGQWVKLVTERIGSTVTHYIDGAYAGSGTFSDGTVFSGTSYLGMASDGSGAFNGNIDEFRMTKGVGRYASAFTPETSPFPDH